MAFECMDDCIHLRACRRVQAIGKKHRLLVPRYCTEDCTAYISREKAVGYVSIDEAVSFAQNGAGSIESGYSRYDVYAPQDLNGTTLGDILDELENK